LRFTLMSRRLPFCRLASALEDDTLFSLVEETWSSKIPSSFFLHATQSRTLIPRCPLNTLSAVVSFHPVRRRRYDLLPLSASPSDQSLSPPQLFSSQVGVSVPSELTPLKKPTLLSIGDVDAMMPMSQVDEAKKTFDDMKTKNGAQALEVIVYPNVCRTSFCFPLRSFSSSLDHSNR
jgi:hypothetical protein